MEEAKKTMDTLRDSDRMSQGSHMRISHDATAEISYPVNMLREILRDLAVQLAASENRALVCAGDIARVRDKALKQLCLNLTGRLWTKVA